VQSRLLRPLTSDGWKHRSLWSGAVTESHEPMKWSREEKYVAIKIGAGGGGSILSARLTLGMTAWAWIR
jgi:hypothetical protein